MGISSMQGTSAHIEYIGPKGRKHRKNCIYYKYSKCSCKTSQAYMMKCIGRLCCGKYEDSPIKKTQLEEEKEILKNSYNININTNITSKNFKKSSNKKKRISSVNIKNIPQNNLLGKTFELRSLKFNEDITIKIVPLNEQSEINRKYSTDSVFARALLGKKVGDTVRVNFVKGCLSYRVLEIR